MITSFNTQRANISVLQQKAYIRDLTAVVNVSIGLFDPDIGYIQSGTTLDVRPIVSHDKKYITLELRPTIAELTELRPIAISAQGISGAEFIEAPEVVLKAIRTTVSVPDGGTLLIGGYSTGQEIDDYSGLPFFSKIPILNMLTGASLRDRERTNNYMLVKATLVDQTEIERDIFGKLD
jgi:type II secretory pathway component GspD/PulD (secretin)